MAQIYIITYFIETTISLYRPQHNVYLSLQGVHQVKSKPLINIIISLKLSNYAYMYQNCPEVMDVVNSTAQDVTRFVAVCLWGIEPHLYSLVMLINGVQI